MIDRLSKIGVPSPHRTTSKEEVEQHEKQFTLQQQNIGPNKNALDLNEKEKQKIQEVVRGLNEFLQPSHTSLKFQYHDELNEYYVSVVDDSTSEIVREIPSKKLLDFYAAMTEFVGLMVDKKI